MGWSNIIWILGNCNFHISVGDSDKYQGSQKHLFLCRTLNSVNLLTWHDREYNFSDFSFAFNRHLLLINNSACLESSSLLDKLDNVSQSYTNSSEGWRISGDRQTYHNRPGRRVLMPHRLPAAERGSRAPAFPRAPSPTHRNSESLLGLDERLQTSTGGNSRPEWACKLQRVERAEG